MGGRKLREALASRITDDPAPPPAPCVAWASSVRTLLGFGFLPRTREHVGHVSPQARSPGPLRDEVSPSGDWSRCRGAKRCVRAEALGVVEGVGLPGAGFRPRERQGEAAGWSKETGDRVGRGEQGGAVGVLGGTRLSLAVRWGGGGMSRRWPRREGRWPVGSRPEQG